MNEFANNFFEKLMQDFDSRLNHSGIDGKRLANRLALLSEIGVTSENGSNRMGFSKEERQAKELVKSWMQEAGLVVREDGAGNVFGRLKGKDSTAPAILSGSHVDSVPNGGHFDGPLGVLVALEVAEAWNETGFQPRKSYEVVVFTDEEGARFSGGFSGSAAMIGDVNEEDQLKLRDLNGDSFKTVIEADGLSVAEYFSAKRNVKEEIAAFIEVHIEQGKQLEKKNLPVGVVTGIAGPCWLELSFHGEAGHAGNTPMNDRKDALIAASMFIHELERFPKEVSPTAVATVGRVQVYPNGINVIPGKVTLTVDVRDIFKETRDLLVEEIIKMAQEVAEHRGVRIEVIENLRIAPVLIPVQMQGKMMKAVEEHGVEAHLLPSGAGHDSMIVGRHVPTAMLFVRSKDGISHNPKEWSSLNDCVMAAHVLKSVIEDLAE
ncbi:M20 family metallo-hydrolase [Anaerobacillus sp. CMMVII]|uniref:M20 family metallo-hydrolase n=1 Tax=Anaerobacillus sp. CMMVII TaxID=2755588 RepID=UPI0021B73558|nr:M20 family metallo-hydrolase [Anaerobacillus sp. CMMVII]MCT8138322.1 M20 family metallo-hydrolase [Anaerobacillus sp. CMMVII]